ncbi:hypothetical protein [Flavobacterium hibisci]|uniref:hypothetical protein n=1 Tax=Flavobacterium hibisci TaxID=1914462 RepID=UPI001CBADE6B|nr:hypothetical protein [Flavobacterium hibisci]MBZ4041922.1 hypothetical protein [Flavobacterium hibisci]
MLLGILDIEKKNKDYFEKYTSKGSRWIEKKTFNTFEDYHIDFSNLDFLTLLANNEEKQIQLAKELADQIIKYIDSQEEYVLKVCKKIKQSI